MSRLAVPPPRADTMRPHRPEQLAPVLAGAERDLQVPDQPWAALSPSFALLESGRATRCPAGARVGVGRLDPSATS